jgi:hypothetical protein
VDLIESCLTGLVESGRDTRGMAPAGRSHVGRDDPLCLWFVV